MTLVGRASWAEKTLIECGRFYPPDCKAPEARLRYYASIFPLVEVDSKRIYRNEDAIEALESDLIGF